MVKVLPLLAMVKTFGKTSSLNWLLGILAVLALLISRPVITEEQWDLWLLFAGLIALVINLNVVFESGEVSAAHTVSLMAYLIMATEDTIAPPLWSISVGSLIGHIIYQARTFSLRQPGKFFDQAGGPILVGVSQQVLGLYVADFIYRAVGGNLPLEALHNGDILPVSAFVATFLAVYLAILILDTRERRRISGGSMGTQNWQILVGVLVSPLPFAVLGAVVLAQVSALAFSLLIAGLLLIVTGVYTLSHAQQEYQQQVRELSSLSVVNRAMRTQLDLRTLQETTFLQVAHLLHVQDFTLALYDFGRQMVDFPINIRNLQSIPRPSRHKDKYLIDYVIDSQSPLLISHSVPEVAQQMGLFPPDPGVYSWLGVPLLTTDRAFGCVVVLSRDPERYFTESDKRVLVAVVTQASVALENAQLYERTRRHVSQLKALTIATSELGRTLAPTHVLDAIWRNAPSIAGAQAAAVFLFWDKQNLAFVGSTGFPAMTFDRTPIMPLMVENQATIPDYAPPFVVMDTHADARVERFRGALDNFKKRALVEVVLKNPQTQELFGILVVYFDEPTYIDNERMEVIQMFAQQASLSISNAQLYSQTDAALSRKVGQLSLLAETGTDMTSTHDMQGLLDLVLDRAMKGTSSGVGGLIMLDNEQGIKKPRIARSQGYKADVFTHFDVLAGTNSEVYKTKKPVIRKLTESQEFRLSEESAAQMNVPLLRDNEVIGILTLENRVQDGFSADDVTFIIQLLSQASIALDNIQLLNNLAEGRDRLQVILDSMTEAILLIDKDGTIALANPRVETLLQLPPGQLINQPISELAVRAELKIADQLGFEIEELLALVQELQAGVWVKPEARKDYQLTIPQVHFIQRQEVPVRDAGGKVIGILLVFVDVTEERELRQQQEELSSMIVHDLRSPLTAVTASLRLMQEITSPEDAIGKIIHQTSDVSSRAVRKLLNLVNSLLDISKMETGMMTLDQEPASVHALADNVIHELEPLAQEMEVNLVNAVEQQAPLLNIDSDKIERVLYNLVDNAIKFTPSDGKVTILITHDHAPDGFIRVDVRDTGPGIPEQYKNTLFNRYEQVKDRRGRRRGTGLGLTFCKLTVEAHGGRIWIEDNPGGGSVFAFTLPVASIPENAE